MSNKLCVALLVLVLLGCGETTEPNPALNVVLTGLAPLSDGSYEGWVIDAAGSPHSTGTFQYNAAGDYPFTSPVADPAMFVLTVEPPNDTDPAPSGQKLLGGPFVSGVATLSPLGFVSMDPTADFASSPGTHVLLTPTTTTSSDDDSGIWLLDPLAAGGPTATVTLPVLTSGWVYEGWVVYGPGTAMETAVSYGKFTPQSDGVLTGRDSDAGGPLSGAPGDLSSGPPFPGGDFVAANGNTVSGTFPLPADFNGDDVIQGDSNWMHVISIEPAFDIGEPSLNATPFLLKPYGNPFGDGGPTDARTIGALSAMPTGTATIN